MIRCGGVYSRLGNIQGCVDFILFSQLFVMPARNRLFCFEQQLNPVDHSGPVDLNVRGEAREKQKEETTTARQVTRNTETTQRNRIHDRWLSNGCNFMFLCASLILAVHVMRRITVQYVLSSLDRPSIAPKSAVDRPSIDTQSTLFL